MTEDARLPTWLVRLLIGAALTWTLALVGQLVAGVWWAASLSAKVDSIERLTGQAVGQHEREIRVLQDDVKVLDDKVANVKKDLAILLDRGGLIRVQGASP